MKRARYLTTGVLAIDPKAFGIEFATPASAVAETPFEMAGSVAVIRITGPLEAHPHPFWQDYETLHKAARGAFDSTGRAVGVFVDSPGGAAAGCFEFARALRAMSVETGKPLGVFVDGQATSAAYAIASSATAGIHARPTSTVASLAVYEMMVDQTQMDAQLGLRFLFVPSSGADLKLTGNPHVPQSEAQIAHTQAQVDLLTEEFYALVEDMRGVPREQIRALRGASLLAMQAIAKGLVDTTSDWTGFLASLESQQGTMSMTTQAKAKSDDKSSPMSMEECMAALISHAEGEDEEKAKKAKRALRALLKDEKGGDDGGGEEPESRAAEDKPEPEKEPEAKASEEKPKEEPEAKAGGDYIPKAAASTAPGPDVVEMARQLHAMQAERAQEKEARARADLFAQRPDFSDEVKQTLGAAPLAVVENAVKTWPRAAVTDRRAAAASAAVPGVVPGQLDGAQAPHPSDQMRMLDRLGADKRPQAAQARMDGASLVFEPMTREKAAARVKEMREQGIAPRGTPHDMSRITQTTFKESPAPRR